MKRGISDDGLKRIAQASNPWGGEQAYPFEELLQGKVPGVEGVAGALRTLAPWVQAQVLAAGLDEDDAYYYFSSLLEEMGGEISDRVVQELFSEI